MNRNPINQHTNMQASAFIAETAAADPPDSSGTALGTGIAKPSTSASCLLKYLDWLLISGMLLVLFAPLAGKILGWPQEVDLKENRNLPQPPVLEEITWAKLPHAIDQWWNDRFAFRTQLIPLRESIWLGLLSAPGKQYIRGKDGQLFLNLMPGETHHGAQNATVLDYLGVNRLTAKQLSDWTDYLEGKSAWLRAHGIHYLFVISPNKITVQDHFLPNTIRMAKGMSYFEQLREDVFLRLTKDVDLLDLTPALIAKEIKTGISMFSRKNDVTHWNGAGYYEGLVAMDEHLRRSFPDMPPFPEDKIELQKSTTDPTVFSCQWKNDPSVHAVEETIITTRTGDWTDSKRSKAMGRHGNLVLFSDSSWKGLCAGLESFFPGAHTAFPYQWGRHLHADIYHVTFNELQRIVKEEHPNVIVEAQTERALMIPPGIGVPAEFRLAARFARGNTFFILTINELNTLFGVNVDGTAIEEDAIVINSTNDDPALETSMLLRVPEDSESVLLIDVDVPDSGIFQVFWSDNNEFSGDNSINAVLEKGRNVLFLPIPLPAGKTLRTRIDPGNVPGKYRIRKIEIRSTSSIQQ